MKGFVKTVKENTNKSWAVVITSVLAVLTLITDQATELGLDPQLTAWFLFAIAAITAVWSVVKSNTTADVLQK